MNKVSISREELKRYAEDTIAFYGLDISRISTVFMAQIYQLGISGALNINAILDEVKYLEGKKETSRTGEAKPLRGKQLKGLYKKHFTDARFIMKNIGLHLGVESGNTENLEKIIHEAALKKDAGCSEHEIVNYLTHHLTAGAYQERSKKALTGEWIVFKKHEGKNYYLVLAEHGNDELVSSYVRLAYEMDFKFLLNIVR
jgi:hypothetical protein